MPNLLRYRNVYGVPLRGVAMWAFREIVLFVSLPLLLAAAPEPGFVLHCTYTYHYPQNGQVGGESYLAIDPAEQSVFVNTSGKYRDGMPADGVPGVTEWVQISSVVIWFGSKVIAKDKGDVVLEEVDIDRTAGTFIWAMNSNPYASGTCERSRTQPVI